jgi:2-polyprenyl-6-hydroxyphenyl methylase/3-demethylubiquinone-9 3-methyltransferase
MTNADSPAAGAEAGGPNADARFVEYYAQASLSPKTAERFANVKRKILALRARLGFATENLSVADIGCGAGTQSMLWAVDGHRVRGLDISAPLVTLGQRRAAEQGVAVELSVGSATMLPYPDESFDVVLLPELLEHLPQWQPCLDEAARVLRPGGVLYLSTTSVLCPLQQEFSLPLYSWYPRWLKTRCEKLAVTTHKDWVKHTSFPAVHWFSFYQLRDYLSRYGVACYDRFDMIDEPNSAVLRMGLAHVQRVPLLRWFGHVLTPYTAIFGVRRER